jgi:hypothetical protein
MMLFSAHYSDREPEYFGADTWKEGAMKGSAMGTMITLYWLADDEGPSPMAHVERRFTPDG